MRYLPYLIIAVALVLAAWIAAHAFTYRTKATETILVTGRAEKDFVSDQIVWGASFSRQAVVLRDAYAQLKQDEAEIRRYLHANGIPDSNIVFSSVDVRRRYDEQYDANGRQSGSRFAGYELSGNVTVDSRNIGVVERLSREITGLLEQGIELNSTPPDYYYSKLNDLKIDLLAKAAQDALRRGETIAGNSGTRLGKVRKASMGVFQITGRNSNEDFSYGGAFNTTAREKTASITMRVEYGMN